MTDIPERGAVRLGPLTAFEGGVAVGNLRGRDLVLSKECLSYITETKELWRWDSIVAVKPRFAMSRFRSQWMRDYAIPFVTDGLMLLGDYTSADPSYVDVRLESRDSDLILEVDSAGRGGYQKREAEVAASFIGRLSTEREVGSLLDHPAECVDMLARLL